MSGSRRKPRVLVAGDDYYASLATVRGLRKGGYEPWFATHHDKTLAERSRATVGVFTLPKPEDGDGAYVTALAAAAATCQADVVLPCNELAIKAIAAHADAFAPEVAVGTVSRDVVRRATDKAELSRLAAEVGLAAPPTMELLRDDVDARLGEIEFPAVLKPTSSAVKEHGRTWLAPPTTLVRDAGALRRLAAKAPHWLVQPYLEGTLTAVSGVAWQGRVVCSVHQAAHRIHPQHLGVSAYAETIAADDRVGEPLAEIIRRLGWSGIYEFQLIRCTHGDYVIDLNPRPYGSLALAIGAGLNLPAIWTDLLLGREPVVGTARVGVRYRAESRDYKALASAVGDRRIAEALRIARPRRRTVHAIFSFRDPAPLITAFEILKAGRIAKAG